MPAQDTPNPRQGATSGLEIIESESPIPEVHEFWRLNNAALAASDATDEAERALDEARRALAAAKRVEAEACAAFNAYCEAGS